LNCGNLDDMLMEHIETLTLLRSVLFPLLVMKMWFGMGLRKGRRVGVASSYPQALQPPRAALGAATRCEAALSPLQGVSP
jgi:hypothetical protein